MMHSLQVAEENDLGFPDTLCAESKETSCSSEEILAILKENTHFPKEKLSKNWKELSLTTTWQVAFVTYIKYYKRAMAHYFLISINTFDDNNYFGEYFYMTLMK